MCNLDVFLHATRVQWIIVILAEMSFKLRLMSLSSTSSTILMGSFSLMKMLIHDFPYGGR